MFTRQAAIGGSTIARRAPNRKHLAEPARKPLSEQALSDASALRTAVFAPTSVVTCSRWTLHPQSTFSTLWDSLILLCVFATAISAPYRLAFDTNVSDGGEVFELFLDALFAVDVALTFFTAFFNDDSVLVKDHKRIAVRYFQSLFVFDAISLLGILSSTSRPLRYLRVLKLLRLLRLTRTLLSLETLYVWLDLHPSTIRIASLLSNVCYLAHLLACIWYFASVHGPKPELVSADSPARFIDQSLFSYSGFDSDSLTSIADAHNGSGYLATLYFVVVAIFGIGYGDLVAQSSTEKVIAIFVMLAGSMSVGLIVGSIAATVQSRGSKATGRFAEVRQYLRDRNFPLALRKRVKKYFRYYLAHKPSFDEKV
jgi:hypothetical protein